MASRRRHSQLVFIVGGASSGKSEVALRLAAQGIARTAARAFVATGEGQDEEMAMKIARHRQSRSSWAWLLLRRHSLAGPLVTLDVPAGSIIGGLGLVHRGNRFTSGGAVVSASS